MSASLLAIGVVALGIGAWLAWALRRARAATILITALGVPAASIAVYVALGSPDLADVPLAQRDEPAVQQARQRAEFRKLTGVLAERLREEPDSLEGWTMLSTAYGRLGEPAFAAEAWRKVLALKGEEAAGRDWAHLAELLIKSADGEVSPSAATAIEQALKLDPNEPQARHFAALRLAQAGDTAAAAAIWREMLAGAPPDAAWRPAIADYLARAERTLGAPQRGPSEEDVRAAQEMSAEERQAMVEGMVDSLATRLEEQPDDPAGWLRLGRAYQVLGRKEQADTALRKAEDVALAQLSSASE
ncbi:MAG TPA: hypothetical protein VKA18_05685, partial [Alphaproteobacteria bacterium]|nr:hypothetical protein [Alphaproteobacteria bacterium]